MTSYQRIWDIAEENHGVITTSTARRIGVPPAALVSLATNGKLIHLGYGVYKLEFHVPGQYDEYAQAVALVGETAFVRGASALMLRGLIPFDPARMYLGVSRRFRRHLPDGYVIKTIKKPSLEQIEGIPVQVLSDAIADARSCGSVDLDRLSDVEGQP